MKKKFLTLITVALACVLCLAVVPVSAEAPDQMVSEVRFNESMTFPSTENTKIGEKMFAVPTVCSTSQITTVSDGNGGYYLKLYRADGSNKEVYTTYLDNMSGALSGKYVYQLDVKLDPDITLSTNTKVIYGLKRPESGVTTINFVQTNTNGVLFTRIAGQIVVIGQLATDTWTNLAVAFDDVNRTYCVYVDGVMMHDAPIAYSADTYAGIPAEVATEIRTSLQTGTQGDAVCECALNIDNLRVYNSTMPILDAKIDNVKYVGSQETAVASDKFDIRFTATVDSLEYDKVGIKVTAKYTEGGEEKVVDFSGAGTEVYAKIKAAGGTKEYTAAELGGEYIIAFTAKDVPANVGAVVFTVEPYVETAGIRAYGESTTVTYTSGQFTS